MQEIEAKLNNMANFLNYDSEKKEITWKSTFNDSTNLINEQQNYLELAINCESKLIFFSEEINELAISLKSL